MDKYTLVVRESPSELITGVNEAMKEGYNPIGGVTCHMDWWIQAVVQE